MKLQITNVFDNISGNFMRPQFDAATGVSIRNFVDEVNRNAADNIMFHHCGDFALFHMGTFDTETGDWEIFAKAQLLCDGIKVKMTAQ